MCGHVWVRGQEERWIVQSREIGFYEQVISVRDTRSYCVFYYDPETKEIYLSLYVGGEMYV